MAQVTAAAVKALREKTDLPMMDCKKALVEAEGDEERAIQILRESYEKVKVKRADNETSEGRIFTLVKEDGSVGALVEIQCESAPVAGGEDLKNFGTMCVEQLLNGPGATTGEELLAQPAPGTDGKTLNEVFEEMVNKIREKIVVSGVAKLEGPVGAYVHHDGKTGVLFQATGDKANAEVLRDVAMHVAAMRPEYTTVEDVDSALVEAERTRLSEEAKATGKPENIIEKIVDGQMKKFYAEKGVLEWQPFAKEDTKTVSQALAEHGLKAKSFHASRVGG